MLDEELDASTGLTPAALAPRMTIYFKNFRCYPQALTHGPLATGRTLTARCAQVNTWSRGKARLGGHLRRAESHVKEANRRLKGGEANHLGNHERAGCGADERYRRACLSETRNAAPADLGL